MKPYLVIALAHMRMFTAKMRRFRGPFMLIITILLVLWGVFVIPPILAAIVPDMQYLEAFLLPYMGGLIDYIFAMIFGFFLMYQLSSALQNLEEGQHEILLATPIKEGDIFLGEYLGRIPVYAWGIMFIVPMITGLLQNLFGITGLDVFVISLLVTLLIALAAWIGAIITGFIVKRVARSPRGKDFGKALTFLIAVIFVIGFYGFNFLGQEAIADLNFRAWLQILPSSWFGNIVNSLIGAPLALPWFNSSWSLVAIVVFAVVVFVGGYKLAPHFYSLDIGGTQVQISIEGEHGFFRLMRRVVPASWAILAVTSLKTYVRRKENLSKLAYVIVIVIFLTVIQRLTSGDSLGGASGILDLLLTPWMFTLMLGTMLGSYIFVQSKDVLWIYKQSPRGIKSLVLGSLLAMITLSIPIAIGICIFLIFSNQLDAIQGVSLVIAMLFGTFGSLGMSMGIGSLNPVYKQKSGKLALNTFAFMGIQLSIFFSLINWLFNNFFSIGSISNNLILIALLMSFFELGIGIPLLYLGIWRLQKIE